MDPQTTRRPRAALLAGLLGLELPLILVELLCVLYPLVSFVPQVSLQPALVAAAGGGLLLWLLALGIWLRPVLADSRSPLERYRAGLALPARALVLRILLWEALGLAVAFQLPRIDRQQLALLLVIFLLHPLPAGFLRWALQGRLLRRYLTRCDLLPAWLQLQLDTLRTRLLELTALTSAGAAALGLIYVSQFVQLSAEQRLAVQLHYPWTVGLLALLWAAAVLPLLLRPLWAYLRCRAVGGATPDAQLLGRATRAAHELPRRHALAQVLVFSLAGALFWLQSGPLLGVPSGQALQVLAGMVVMAGGAAIYNMFWARAELRSVVTHLLAQPGADELQIRAPSLRQKMLLSFGGVAAFSISLAALLPVGALSVERLDPLVVALFYAALAALAAGVVLLGSVDLTRPLGALERRAAEMTQGYLTQEVFHEGDYDTSGRLSSAFEQMRRSLLAKLHTIEKMNQELEQKVQQRTADLERSNAELTRALSALQQAQQQLVVSEKMASVGQLVAGIAHEINNPINAVVNTLSPLAEAVEELTSSETEPDDRQQASQELTQMLRVIRSGASRSLQIVSALRNYSRQDEEALAPMDLHADIEETLALLAHKLRDVELARDFGAAPGLQAYRGQLNQALMNLLANAAAAVEGQPEARIEIRTRDLDDGVQIQIQDNGPGIPEQHQARIFDPFFTTREVGQGTGLGLSITHGIIQHHGGQISVESAPGRTVFTVQVPRDR